MAYGKATNGDEAAPNTTSGGAATLHTPALEALAVGPSVGVRPTVTDGGGGNAGNQSNKSEAEVDEDTETGIRCGTTDKPGIPTDVCGQAGREGVPRVETATLEVAED